MFTCKSCCDFAHRLSRTNAARWWTLQLPYSSRDGVRFRNPDALRRRPIRPDEPPRERRKVDDEFHDHLGECSSYWHRRVPRPVLPHQCTAFSLTGRLKHEENKNGKTKCRERV